MSIGQRLKTARDERNISIEDVARRTNIRQRFLEAIDSDDLSTIPPSHQRLFVREYAKCVGVNPDEVLAELPEVSPVVIAPEAETDDTATYRSSSSESDRREYREILNRISSSGGKLRSVTGNPVFMLIGTATVLLLAVAVYYFVWGKDSGASGDAMAQMDTTAAQTEILSAPETGDTASATPAAETDTGDSLTLEGRATARVWFTIVMDGKRSETGTLDSGMVKTWRAFETFKVSLGNAGGLQLLLNERALGTLGPASSVVRSRVIDKDGIRPGPGRTPVSAVAPGTSSPAVRRITSSRPTTRRSPARTSSRAARATTRRAEPMKEILTTEIR